MNGAPRHLALAVLLLAAVAVAARAEHPAVARAERAVAAGAVDPARDLGPLLEALRRSRDVDEKRELVEAIGDLGEADGGSPNAVKAYLAEQAAPLLLEVIRTGANNFLQGDAVHALRGMRVPRGVLEQAAALAEADPDAYVQSRGEILRGYIAALPAEDAATATRATDPQARAAAIAYLDQRGLTASTEALRDAARRADPEAVRALLDAGIAPEAGATEASQTPLYATLAQGCHLQGAETDWLVETVEILIAAGADVNRLDDNRNPPLIHAAHYCGPRIATLLVDAGAKIDARNGSGITPLALALIMGNFDAAEALVAKGARLGKDDATMVSGVTDPRGKALIQKASRPAGRP
ncbi:MAG: ankyrin repeat domain-containing protein [Thermoanaerobaculia bacterium]|nr:ankyrin repeat domain-containing protein [Thermoanaerobaculia bacterium]